MHSKWSRIEDRVYERTLPVRTLRHTCSWLMRCVCFYLFSWLQGAVGRVSHILWDYYIGLCGKMLYLVTRDDLSEKSSWFSLHLMDVCLTPMRRHKFSFFPVQLKTGNLNEIRIGPETCRMRSCTVLWALKVGQKIWKGKNNRKPASYNSAALCFICRKRTTRTESEHLDRNLHGPAHTFVTLLSLNTWCCC